MVPTGQPPFHYQGSTVNLECREPFLGSSFRESWKITASSPKALVAEKPSALDDFENSYALGHVSSQNEYFPSNSTWDLDTRWSGRSNGAPSRPEPPVLDCQCVSFATQSDLEQCHRTAECSLHVDQEYLSWRQSCQSPIPKRLSTAGPTCSLGICSSWSSSLQGPTLNDSNPCRSFAVAAKHNDELLSSGLPRGRWNFPYQDDYPQTDGLNTYGPCETSSELLNAALSFTPSTSNASPEEKSPSIAFSSQYLLGDSDPPGNPSSLQHTASEAACAAGHTSRALHTLSYGLTEPEQTLHEPVQPNEMYSEPTESFNMPAAESHFYACSSSPYLSDSLEYAPGNSSKRNARRNSKDGFLIRSKLSGMSYREIKVKGRFNEAESTLRGRFRTLTKRKEQRVRKPQWQERDVSTLHLAHALLENLGI